MATKCPQSRAGTRRSHRGPPAIRINTRGGQRLRCATNAAQAGDRCVTGLCARPFDLILCVCLRPRECSPSWDMAKAGWMEMWIERFHLELPISSFAFRGAFRVSSFQLRVSLFELRFSSIRFSSEDFGRSRAVEPQLRRQVFHRPHPLQLLFDVGVKPVLFPHSIQGHASSLYFLQIVIS